MRRRAARVLGRSSRTMLLRFFVTPVREVVRAGAWRFVVEILDVHRPAIAAHRRTFDRGGEPVVSDRLVGGHLEIHDARRIQRLVGAPRVGVLEEFVEHRDRRVVVARERHAQIAACSGRARTPANTRPPRRTRSRTNMYSWLGTRLVNWTCAMVSAAGRSPIRPSCGARSSGAPSRGSWCGQRR